MLFNRLYHIECKTYDVFAHQGCYADYVSGDLPTFRYILSVPSSRVKQVILGMLDDIVDERRSRLKRGGSSKYRSSIADVENLDVVHVCVPFFRLLRKIAKSIY